MLCWHLCIGLLNLLLKFGARAQKAVATCCRAQYVGWTHRIARIILRAMNASLSLNGALLLQGIVKMHMFVNLFLLLHVESRAVRANTSRDPLTLLKETEAVAAAPPRTSPGWSNGPVKPTAAAAARESLSLTARDYFVHCDNAAS